MKNYDALTDDLDHAFDDLDDVPDYEEAVFVALLGNPYAYDPEEGTYCDQCGCRFCVWPCPKVGG